MTRATINGIGQLASGKLNEGLTVNGIAKIPEAVSCSSLTINGLLKAKDSVLVQGPFTCNGMGKIKGHLQVEGNGINAGTLKIEGQFYLTGNLKLSGTIKANEDISVLESIKGDGMLTTHKTLHSHGNIELTGRVKVGENVIANNLIIKMPKTAKHLNIKSKIAGEVAVQNTIDIENTIVERNIKARNVVIREGCEIFGGIYYVDTIQIDPSVNLQYQPQQISLESLLQ